MFVTEKSKCGKQVTNTLQAQTAHGQKKNAVKFSLNSLSLINSIYLE